MDYANEVFLPRTTIALALLELERALERGLGAGPLDGQDLVLAFGACRKALGINEAHAFLRALREERGVA